MPVFPLLEHFLRSLIDWLFRRRSSALTMMRTGASLLAVVGIGWGLDLSIPVAGEQIDLSFRGDGGLPTPLVYVVAAMGVALTTASAIWEFRRGRAQERRLARKKVVVVETRGLRDTSGTSLVEAVPPSMEGHRNPVLVDLRQGVKDGEILVPESALENLRSLPQDLKRRLDGFDRRDITVVYGGLAPVPFTFLTGVVMDDEGEVTVFDWDRHGQTWQALDGTDDGKRFRVEGLDAVPSGTADVALAVSVSYRVDLDGVYALLGDAPVVSLELDSGAPDCHWSAEKQQALGRMFLETAVALSDRGVRRIHLFLAAQNSIAFRFGRLYDKRNLPELFVYQYQRGEIPPYPWGLRMPVSGREQPTVVKTGVANGDATSWASPIKYEGQNV